MKHDDIAVKVAALLRGLPHILNISSERGLRAEASEGSISHLERWTGGAASLTLNDRQGRTGFSSLVFGKKGFNAPDLVSRALASASVMGFDPADLIPPFKKAAGPDALSILDPENRDMDEKRAGEMALRLYESARAAGHMVTSVRKPSFDAVFSENTVIVNGETAAHWEETSYSLHAEVAAGPKDDPQFGWAAASGRVVSSLSPENTGKEAGMRAVELIGARPPPTGIYPVLFDNRSGADLLDVLAPSLYGENLRKKTSLFNGLMGRKVFSEKISIVDDGLLPGGDETGPVDDEGTPCRATACVSEGRLARLLYSRCEAARQGKEPTGNGFSGGGPPLTGATNLYIKNGTAGQRELFGAFGKIIFIRELLGIHTADPISGDFSVGFSGLMIEKGEMVHPVTGGAVSGNLRGLFKGVVETGNDLCFHGGYGSPSLLVEGLSISGQDR